LDLALAASFFRVVAGSVLATGLVVAFAVFATVACLAVFFAAVAFFAAMRSLPFLQTGPSQGQPPKGR
jgi:hypothetical protein